MQLCWLISRCARGDLNPYAEAEEPKSSVYAIPPHAHICKTLCARQELNLHSVSTTSASGSRVCHSATCAILRGASRDRTGDL